MKKYIKIASAFLIALAFTGCGSSIPVPQELGGSLYSQHNFWYSKGRNYSTNYSRGKLMPVNSEVKITKITAKAIFFDVLSQGGEKVHIIVDRRNTDLDAIGMAKRYFAPTKKDLSKFTQQEVSAITAGMVDIGMSKAAVLVARGYPPTSLTPTTEANYWLYQKNKYNPYVPIIRKTGITFKNNKVVDIK